MLISKNGFFGGGPQIRELTQDVKFEDQPNAVGETVWKSSRNVTKNFGGKS
jgi:hypothetical protein